MSVNWYDGIEGEANSARRAREESIEALRKLQSRQKWFYVLPVFNTVLLLLNLFSMIEDFSWVNPFIILLLAFAIKVSLKNLSLRRSQIESARREVDAGQKTWDAVCVRLAAGEC